MTVEIPNESDIGESWSEVLPFPRDGVPGYAERRCEIEDGVKVVGEDRGVGPI